MKAKIVWLGTGDEIVFIPRIPDFFAYWFEQINVDKVNKFRLQKTKMDPENLSGLAQCVNSCRSLSNKIPFLIQQWIGDPVDQDYLNHLHRDWVKTGVRFPKLIELLKKLGADHDWRNINFYIHEIESSFLYRFVNYELDPYQLANKFTKDILTFDRSNLELGFDNLGRSSFNKFVNRDHNVNDTDTNDRSILSGQVDLNLSRPMSGSPPPEYIRWCKENNWPVVGERISLGNIENLDQRLTSIRKILIHNVNEQNDQFTFEICSQ